MKIKAFRILQAAATSGRTEIQHINDEIGFVLSCSGQTTLKKQRIIEEVEKILSNQKKSIHDFLLESSETTKDMLLHGIRGSIQSELQSYLKDEKNLSLLLVFLFDYTSIIICLRNMKYCYYDKAKQACAIIEGRSGNYSFPNSRIR